MKPLKKLSLPTPSSPQSACLITRCVQRSYTGNSWTACPHYRLEGRHPLRQEPRTGPTTTFTVTDRMDSKLP
ncbi:hypothetical protein J4Q44_G00171220 [Coregonus suidteri]|uniref:Uncharacterized protein n=1 Tax=Coregonus suidteri TaxID=861788 RepID=A0AAN8LF44_9TELE